VIVATLVTVLTVMVPTDRVRPDEVFQSPDSVLAACATAQRLTRSALGLETRLERDVTVVNDRAPAGRRERIGCRVFGQTGEDRGAAPVDVMLDALQVEGWQPLWAYGADGPDGSLMGLTVGPALCLLRGSWDGGDDSDTTYVPAPGYALEITCFRRTPDDEPR
jgi:hypothetical protein